MGRYATGTLNDDALTAHEFVTVPVITATDLTDAKIFSLQPPWRYQLLGVRSYCRTKAGTVSAVVKVGATQAATVAFTAGAEVAAFSGEVLGTVAQPITVELTTDATGSLGNGSLTLILRPYTRIR